MKALVRARCLLAHKLTHIANTESRQTSVGLSVCRTQFDDSSRRRFARSRDFLAAATATAEVQVTASAALTHSLRLNVILSSLYSHSFFLPLSLFSTVFINTLRGLVSSLSHFSQIRESKQKVFVREITANQQGRGDERRGGQDSCCTVSQGGLVSDADISLLVFQMTF